MLSWVEPALMGDLTSVNRVREQPVDVSPRYGLAAALTASCSNGIKVVLTSPSIAFIHVLLQLLQTTLNRLVNTWPCPMVALLVPVRVMRLTAR